MGRVKQLLEEPDCYDHSGMDTFVCTSCIDDDGLKNFISNHATHCKCSYCGKKSFKQKKSICFDDFFDYFLKCVSIEWGDPNNEGVGWDSREGGWYGPNVIDTYELLDNIGIEITTKLHNKIADILFEKEWCKRDPHGLFPDEDLYYSWERFARQVKHESRYVFFKIQTSEKDYREFYSVKEPFEIMTLICKITNDLGLVKTIKKNTKIYRARVSKKMVKYFAVDDLGPPSKEAAKYSNRMSPAGIPMFYGAMSTKTAEKEIVGYENKNRGLVSIATFQTLDDIKILDLTNIPPVPSIFDKEKHDNRWFISFMNSFLEDFTKIIIKDGKEHIDYVPTQVVTEYFKYLFSDSKGGTIHGLLYPSSRHDDGKACVLFFNQLHCTANKPPYNELEKKWLMLLTNETKHYEVLAS